MKKISLLVLIMFTGILLYAQQILIPYKSGNKYGLCDQYRKIIIKPAYDNVVNLKDKYFQYTNTMLRKDSVPRYDGG